MVHVKWTNNSLRIISKFEVMVKNRILKTIDNFEQGKKVDIQKLAFTDKYRIRVGGYRIILKKIEDIYFVLDLGKRENIY